MQQNWVAEVLVAKINAFIQSPLTLGGEVEEGLEKVSTWLSRVVWVTIGVTLLYAGEQHLQRPWTGTGIWICGIALFVGLYRCVYLIITHIKKSFIFNNKNHTIIELEKTLKNVRFFVYGNRTRTWFAPGCLAARTPLRTFRGCLSDGTVLVPDRKHLDCASR